MRLSFRTLFRNAFFVAISPNIHLELCWVNTLCEHTEGTHCGTEYTVGTNPVSQTVWLPANFPSDFSKSTSRWFRTTTSLGCYLNRNGQHRIVSASTSSLPESLPPERAQSSGWFYSFYTFGRSPTVELFIKSLLIKRASLLGTCSGTCLSNKKSSLKTFLRTFLRNF